LRAERYIKQRTRKGRDVEGKPFAKYSKAHAKRREKLGLPTSVVNLQMDDINGMMVSLDHTVNTNLNAVHVFIKGRRSQGRRRFTNMQLAKWHSVDGVGKKRVVREFWGLNDDEQERILRYIGSDIRKFILETL